MTSERLKEQIQNPEVKEAIRNAMFGHFEEQKKRTLRSFKMLNQYAQKGQILFVGSSLMEGFPIHEMQMNLELEHKIYNRGIGGTTTIELLEAMDVCIFDLEPAKLFINIGTNDIGAVYGGGYQKERLVSNYDKILNQIKRRLPECEVYIMAYYPINAVDDFGLDQEVKKSMFATRTNENIAQANVAVQELAEKHGFQYINLNEGLTDPHGNLRAELSAEGIHLLPKAYAIILENMKEYL